MAGARPLPRAAALYEALASLSESVATSIRVHSDAPDFEGKRAEIIRQLTTVHHMQIVPALMELFQLCADAKDLNNTDHARIGRQLMLAKSAATTITRSATGLPSLGYGAYEAARKALCVPRPECASAAAGLWEGVEYEPWRLVPFADAWTSFHGKPLPLMQ